MYIRNNYKTARTYGQKRATRLRTRDSFVPPCEPKSGLRNVPSGRWRKCLGKGRRRAHSCRFVVMNIAGFKVSHSVGTDKDTTALQAARARSSSSGAMEEMPQTVQNANTHILRCQNHEHAHSSRSVQWSVQWGDGTLHDMHMHTWTWTCTCACSVHVWVCVHVHVWVVGSIWRETHFFLPRHTANSEHTIAMEEMSQTVQNANTHILQGPKSRARAQQWVSYSVQGPVQWGDGGNV